MTNNLEQLKQEERQQLSKKSRRKACYMKALYELRDRHRDEFTTLYNKKLDMEFMDESLNQDKLPGL